VGNVIIELLGLVVRRVPDAKAYAQAEPALVRQLLELRVRLVDYKLGTPLSAPSWPTAFLFLFLMFKFTKNAKNLNLRRRQM